MKLLKQLCRFRQYLSLGRLLLLFSLMLFTGLSEGVGLILLVPLLQSLQPGSTNNTILTRIAGWAAEVGVTLTTEWLLGVLFGLIVIRSAALYAKERVSLRLQYKFVDQLRHRVYSGLLAMEWRSFAQQRRSDHANTLLTDINRLGIGFNFALLLLTSLVTMLAYMVVALQLSWPVTLLAIFSGGLLLLLLTGQRRRALKLGEGLSKANQQMQETVQESLAGIKLVKILGQEARFVETFAGAVKQLRQQQLTFQLDTSLSRAMFQVGGAVLLIAYMLAGLKLWQLEVAQLLTLVLIFSRMIPLFMNAQQQLHHCLHAIPAATSLLCQLDYYGQVAEPLSTAGTGLGLHKELCFDQVAFCYPGKDQNALADISVAIPVHTTTAVIGASGAGKSTFADLLMGLLEPVEGGISVDGTLLTGEQRIRWRRSVAYVPQDVFLFHESIRDNLLWAKPDASDAELQQALECAAADFVATLPQGLDTQVGDGGIRLSGGERQRLALARALLQQPSLLILDEATSALDRDNEQRIRQSLERLHGDLTVVVIGHRLPTLEHADQVLQFDQGRIVAQGSWQQVRHRNENID